MCLVISKSEKGTDLGYDALMLEKTMPCWKCSWNVFTWGIPSPYFTSCCNLHTEVGTSKNIYSPSDFTDHLQRLRVQHCPTQTTHSSSQSCAQNPRLALPWLSTHCCSAEYLEPTIHFAENYKGSTLPN